MSINHVSNFCSGRRGGRSAGYPGENQGGARGRGAPRDGQENFRSSGKNFYKCPLVTSERVQ